MIRPLKSMPFYLDNKFKRHVKNNIFLALM